MKNDLIEQFRLYIGQNILIGPNHTVLLTVSGGIDSMTMLDLFIKSGYKIAIVHCNFQLRGQESDGDQKFVEEFAGKNLLKCFTIKFNTREYASANKISIQMAARELRYNWFEKIANENKFDRIATAHNLNDVIETFFINLTRSTGIKGLTGIKPMQGKLIRPLLFASRAIIEEYAKQNKIAYREDSSNAETKYLRNAIRHNIVPEFEKLNPSFLESVLHTTQLLSEAGDVYSRFIDEKKQKLFRRGKNEFLININRLKAEQFNPVYLFEVLSEFGFSYDTAVKVLESLESQPGICFYSSKYVLVKDRNDLIIKNISDHNSGEFLIGEEITSIDNPINLTIEKLENSDDLNIIKEPNYAFFDKEKLTFPLKIRKWQNGDFFYPFGMTGRKKVSDFFTDNKFSIPAKDDCWLMLSGNEIIWIIGYRSDNCFRITEKTKEVLRIRLNN